MYFYNEMKIQSFLRGMGIKKGEKLRAGCKCAGRVTFPLRYATKFKRMYTY